MTSRKIVEDVATFTDDDFKALLTFVRRILQEHLIVSAPDGACIELTQLEESTLATIHTWIGKRKTAQVAKQ
jgi:hypothetical protein